MCPALLCYNTAMHEYAITQGMLSVVLEHAQRAKAGKVTHINLRLGQMSSFVDDSIQFYFDFLSEGTIAEGAKLLFERVPTQFRCRECETSFPQPDGGLDWDCPNCGSPSVQVVAGQEFFVDSIEVE